ncbi:hypothetical protein ACN0IV_11750 [Trabulsiella odontotermitis]|uniref:hypothetical protein n=1 Tax=Trabulsiella odontotermitis TaxID=379893 RepID=UPI003AC88880
MSEENSDLLFTELKARVESLETQQKAMHLIVNTMVNAMSPQQKGIVKLALKERFAMAVNYGAPGMKETFEIQKKAVESVVGSLG